MSAESEALACCVETVSVEGRKKIQGKVRDIYIVDEKDTVLLVSTDRLSAFDRSLTTIPHKGQVLNLVSAWWFRNTKHIVPNHYISTIDPNVVCVKKCKVFAVEVVVRGYITGSTSTSLWTHYNAGERTYCGLEFPDGLRKNQKLPHNVVTPTTKDEHDMPVSAEQVVSMGLMNKEEWDYVHGKALELFAEGQKTAAKHGMILVDTKYEFGKDALGNILVVDEIHTPDSSRYWIMDSYEDRIAAGQEPENIDKEFVRLWFKKNCDPYKDEVLPEAPADLRLELSKRYIMLYEKITGEKFPYRDVDGIEEAITASIRSYLQSA